MSLFNTEEVKRHNTEEDAWIVVNGIVYDVTQFAAVHPGGKEILLQNAGEIVTGLMKQEDIHVHSEAAYSLLETYRIGKLAVFFKFLLIDTHSDTHIKNFVPGSNVQAHYF